MLRGDKTHIMLYPIPRFSETQLLKFIEYNKISFGEGGRMRSLSRVSRKQRYSTLDFPAENRVPTGMQNSPESIKAFAAFDVTFNICCCQTDRSCRTARHTMCHRLAEHIRHHKQQVHTGIARCQSG